METNAVVLLLAIICVLLFFHLCLWMIRQGWQGYVALRHDMLDLEQRKIELERERANIRLIHLSGDAIPLPREIVETGITLPQQFRLLLESIISRRPPANVPHSLRIDHAHPSQLPPSLTTQPAAAAIPPLAHLPEPRNFWDLWNAGELPADGFLMGYSLDDGQPITASWEHLYSALIGGYTGSGKTTLIRCVLAQAALQGSHFIVIDPHYGAGEQSLGASLEPLRSRMLADVAASPPQILWVINHLHQIGANRMSGADQDETPLVLVIDETTALLSRSSIAPKLAFLLGKIAQEYRKKSIYALCIGQQFSTTIMSSEVRDSFVSMISCRARRSTARIMSGSVEFAKAAESLKIGQAVWLTPGGDTYRIAIPNTTSRHIQSVAMHITPTQPQEPEQEEGYIDVEPGDWSQDNEREPPADTDEDGEADGPIFNRAPRRLSKPDLSPQDVRALHLFRQGSSLKAIITEAYDVTTGTPYTRAVQRFMELLRRMIQ